MRTALCFLVSLLLAGTGATLPVEPPRAEVPVIDTTGGSDILWKHSQHYNAPIRLVKKIHRHAERNDVPREIAMRLVAAESSFDTAVVSSAGAVGLAQVLPSTAGLTTTQLMDVETNLAVGFAYLKRMKERFGSWHTALMAYNDGPTDVARGSRYSESYADEVMGLE